MQRARQCLPHLAALDWEAVVLAVDPRDVAAPCDPLLLETLPPGVPVHRVRALPLALGRWLGLGSLGRRAHGALRRAGDRLLGERAFDLVFFTTTQFIVLTLGPEWKRQFGVPYVLDWQDPWLTDYYERPGAPPPPGGWKYRLAQHQARRHEEPCLREAAGWIGTSQAYRDELSRRYPWFAAKPAAVIPFGASPEDFTVARQSEVQPGFARRPGTRHLVYVGAAGPIMRPALELLFAGVRRWLEAMPDRRDSLRLHFIGTSYAPAGRAAPSVLPLAEAAGVGGLVEEQPARIGHFAALKTLQDADAILLLGSDDAGYSPSKIATLALAGRPVLALIPGGGGLEQQLRNLDIAELARFSPEPETQRVVDFLNATPAPRRSAVRLESLTSAHRARELARLFERALPRDPAP